MMDEHSANAKTWWSCIPKRYVIALLIFFGLFNAYAMRSCLSITITEMVQTSKKPNLIIDDGYCTYESIVESKNNSGSRGIANRQNTTKTTYDWSEYTQGLVLSSFYWGYVISHIPGSFFAEKYGGKHTFGFGILITAILTILTPMAVYAGESTALIILRAVMGLGEGVTYPAANLLIAKWTPPQERSRTASFVYASVMIGTVFATMVSGWILQYSNIGWPLVFYVMGAIAILWYFIWLILCFDTPREDPFISKEEIEYLNESMKEHTNEITPTAPWSHILRSKRVWASVVGLVGYGWMNLSMVTDLSKYLSGVLKLSIEYNGYFSSLIFSCTWLGANATSWLVDYLICKRNVSTTLVRKVGSVFAMPIAAVFLVGASYAGCDRALVIAMFAVAMALKGIAYPSIVTNSLDLSPNYAGTIKALTNGTASLTGIVGPYIIGILTPNQTLSQWRLAFWIMFGVASFCDLVFLVWGSGDVEYWNDPQLVQSKKDKRSKRKIVETKIEFDKGILNNPVNSEQIVLFSRNVS